MEFSAKQIAAMIDGKIVGNPDVTVTSVSKIEEGKAGTLSFLANPKYEDHIYTTKASVVIVNDSFEPRQEINPACTLIKVPEAYSSFARLLEFYDKARMKAPGVHQMASVDPLSVLGKDVYIGAFSYIAPGAVIGDRTQIYSGVYVGDDVKMGSDCTLYPGVKIHRDCLIGNHCTFHAGAVIGADGFGFVPNEENKYERIPQIGNVVIEDYVSVGANSCVDRATIGSTIIRKGVKLDNLVQIGHNVIIGDNTVMAAQAGIAGSTKVGKNVMLGGQVGVIGHIEIADGVKVGAQSGLAKAPKANSVLLGSPAIEADEQKKMWMASRRLPQLMERIAAMEEEIKKLKEKASNG